MNYGLIKVGYPEASRQYDLCRDALRRGRKESHLRDLSRAYWYLKRGRQCIDVLAAILQAGMNSESDPKIAISPAHYKKVSFYRDHEGAGHFSHPVNGSIWNWKSHFSIPKNSFAWPLNANGYRVEKRVQAPVPKVPAFLLAKTRTPLSSMHILWEVEKWEQIPADPLLLKKLTDNLFVVLGQWDLTPLEQALIRGK
jgi:hypothetical protein